jgi:hypothetical protein
MTPHPEPWLRGPLPAIAAPLQPAGHAFVMALEDCTSAASQLSDRQIWFRPGGAASVGFHLQHLSGSTDRLLTYARGEPLSDAQRAALATESAELDPRPSVAMLLDAWRATVRQALVQLEATPVSILQEVRLVGRARLSSTVHGLLFHAAEHAQRHTGQLVTTVKIIRGLDFHEVD